MTRIILREYINLSLASPAQDRRAAVYASLGGFVALLGVPIIVLGESTPVWRCTGMYFTIIFIPLAHGPAHIWCYCIYHATDWDPVFGIYASRLF